MIAVYVALLTLSFRQALRAKGLYYGAAITLTLIFSMMNYNKVVEGDWLWYSAHFIFMKDMSFLEYLGGSFEGLTIKANEPVYYAFAYCLSIATGGNTYVLAVVVTASIYLLIAVALYRIACMLQFDGHEGNNNNATLTATLLFAITFTLTTQLVRQELAVAFVAMSYSYLISKRYGWAGFWAIFAVGCHQSSAFLLMILFAPVAAYIATERRSNMRLPAFCASILVCALLGHFVANSAVAALGANDDGAISPIVLFFDAAVFFSMLVCLRISRGAPAFARLLPVSYVCFGAALAAMMGLPLAMLRLYFYIDFIRAVGLLIISSVIMSRFPVPVGRLFCVSIVALGFWYNSIRIDRSPFDYRGSFVSYLIYPVPI